MNQYQIGVKRAFSARHFLVGGDFGRENELHAHDYCAEVILEGPRLDRFGYLTDIARVERLLEGILERYRGRILNELPEFSGLNPSLENFCRIVFSTFTSLLGPTAGPPAAAGGGDLTRVTVRIFENERDWASFSGPCASP